MRLFTLIFLLFFMLYRPGYTSERKLWSIEAQNIKEYLVLVELNTPPISSLAKGQDLKDAAVQELLKKQKSTIESEQELFLKNLYSKFPELNKNANGPCLQYHWYKIINGLALWIPKNLMPDVYQYLGQHAHIRHRGLGKVARLSSYFRAPQYARTILKKNSFKDETKNEALEATQVQKFYEETSQKGEGITIGIIDTGIDYTHIALGGPGGNIYETLDPKTSNSYFPNQKVVGGMDFVGSDYDPESLSSTERRPKPDANPLDEESHGTHVAAIAAGLPWTSSLGHELQGIAPNAKLYALKVFGKEGSASDVVILEAMEWSIDPNKDDNYEDHLDILNLSLGSDYGLSSDFLSIAINNASDMGVIVLVAAGNAGEYPYVVGSPGVAKAAISVGASVDASPQNTRFPGCEIDFGTKKEIDIVIPATVGTKADLWPKGKWPVLWYRKNERRDLSFYSGKFIYVREEDFSFKELVDLGIKSKTLGIIIGYQDDLIPPEISKEDLPRDVTPEDVKFAFATILGHNRKSWEYHLVGTGRVLSLSSPCHEQVELLNRAQTVASFSSEGPDGLTFSFRPHFLAPGENIQSALMNSGNKEVMYSGTSMATPHASGAMALLLSYYKQKNISEMLNARPGVNLVQIMKEKIMAKTREARDFRSQEVARTTWQGAGILQVFDSLLDIVIHQGAVSLSVKNLSPRDIAKVGPFFWQGEFKIQNSDDEIHHFNCGSKNFTVNGIKIKAQLKKGEEQFTLSAKEVKNATLFLILNIEGAGQNQKDLSAINLLPIAKNYSCVVDDEKTINIPFLGMVEFHSDLRLNPPYLKNWGAPNALARPFYPLQIDENNNAFKGGICALKGIYTRLVEEQGINKTLQFVISPVSPLYHPAFCEFSLFFHNSQGPIKYELNSSYFENVPGVGGYEFENALFDTEKCRELRRTYEIQSESGSRPVQSFNDCLLYRELLREEEPRGPLMLSVPLAKLKEVIHEDKLKVSFRSQLTFATNGENPFFTPYQGALAEIDLSQIIVNKSEYAVIGGAEVRVPSDYPVWYVGTNNFKDAFLFLK